MGGAYHAWLVESALAGAAGFAVLLGALAWTGSQRIADGTVLAARLSARLPGAAPLLAASALWFALGERLEASHADASLLLSAVVIALAAWGILALARWFVRMVAGFALALCRPDFAPRALQWRLRGTPRSLIARRSPLRRRLFARPPPVVSARA